MNFSPIYRQSPPSLTSRFRAVAARAWRFLRHTCAPALNAGLTAAAITMVRILIGREKRGR